MARKSPDHYVKEFAIDAAGAVAVRFYAVYHHPHSAEPVRQLLVTQQAFSYGVTRGAAVVVRVQVPASVEVIKEG